MPSVSPLASPTAHSVEATFKNAFSLYKNGESEKSKSELKRLLQLAPNHAHALHLLGVIAHSSGNAEQAVNLIEQALEQTPGEAQFASNLGEMYRRLGQLDKAIQFGKQAAENAPHMASAHANLGVAYYEQGDLDQAETCQHAALALDSRLTVALNNLGSILRDRGDLVGAQAYYRKVLQLQPENLEAANNLGSVLTESEQPEEALKVLLPIVKIRPDHAEAHCNIGNAFLALERLDKAAAGFQRSLQLKSDNDKAYLGLARVLQEQRDLQGALKMAEQALHLTPNKAQAHTLLGSIYTELAYPDKARASFDEAMRCDPGFAPAYLGRGHLLLENGDIASAKRHFEHALKLPGAQTGAQIALVNADKVKPDDSNMEALIAEATRLDTLPPAKAIPLLFALGKCYDDTKQYDLAFEHYARGCSLKRKSIEYSADRIDLIGQNVRKFFSKENVDRLRGEGCTSALPIFVLGMPRSGTTLTETILASHPLAHGAGELSDMLAIANQPLGQPAGGYPLSLEALRQADLKAMGERYVAGLQARAPDSPRITDKMPANFSLLGLIHLMLPNAKIIHVKRNAVDTCLSCFTRLFNKTQHHSYDLREIGRYYRNYASLMEHWRAVLPAGAFYEVQYEDIIADQEGEARKLLAYCELEWNDTCLDFHKTERRVRTASITQVRQPIYKTSVERWRNYERHLGPLLEELGALAYR